MAGCFGECCLGIRGKGSASGFRPWNLFACMVGYGAGGLSTCNSKPRNRAVFLRLWGALMWTPGHLVSTCQALATGMDLQCSKPGRRRSPRGWRVCHIASCILESSYGGTQSFLSSTN